MIQGHIHSLGTHSEDPKILDSTGRKEGRFSPVLVDNIAFDDWALF